MEIGQVVYSTKGRDSGKYFLIIDIDDRFVYICNGDTRRLENPKKKNIAHIKATKEVINEVKDKLINKSISNKEVKDIISNFNIKQLLEGKEV